MALREHARKDLELKFRNVPVLIKKNRPIAQPVRQGKLLNFSSQCIVFMDNVFLFHMIGKQCVAVLMRTKIF